MKFHNINPSVSHTSTKSVIVLTCTKNLGIFPLAPLPWDYYCSYTLDMMCLQVEFSDFCSNLSPVQELVCTFDHLNSQIMPWCKLSSFFLLHFLIFVYETVSFVVQFGLVKQNIRNYASS